MDANPSVLQKQRLSKRFMNAMKRILGKSLQEINKKYKNEVTQYKKRQFKEIKQVLLRYRIKKKTAANGPFGGLLLERRGGCGNGDLF